MATKKKTEPAQATPADKIAPAPEKNTPEKKSPRTRKVSAEKRAKDDKAKKLGGLDAVAKVLGESGQPMTCQEMTVLWVPRATGLGPTAKRPQATLYSAILREINTKGRGDSPFVAPRQGALT